MYDASNGIMKREFRIILVDLTMKGAFSVPLAQQRSLSPWLGIGPLNSGQTPLGYFHIPLIQVWHFRGDCETDSDAKILLNIYSRPQMDISAYPESCKTIQETDSIDHIVLSAGSSNSDSN